MDDTTDFKDYYIDLARTDSTTQVVQAIERDGFVTFDAIHSEEELLCLAKELGTIVPHRDAEETGITRIITRNMLSQAGYAAFTSADLMFHTDGSSITTPATLVVLWCKQPARVGGRSLFVDGKQIYRVLSEQYPHVLEVLQTPNSVIFGGNTESLLKSAIVNSLEDGTIYIRFRYDALGYYSAPVSAVLPIFLELLNQYSFSLSLQEQQGYILHNGRWLHGRTTYQGSREMYRVLIHTDEQLPLGKRISPGFIAYK